MRFVVKLYDGLIYACAVLAAALLLAMLGMIVADVVIRNLGMQGSAHLFTFTEYLLLIIPCLGAPWLVREKGHVYVEIILIMLSPNLRRRMLIVVSLASILVCLVLAWFGFEVTIRDYYRASKDMRSFDMPRWLIVGVIPVSFLLMATEFLRLLLRGESPIASLAISEKGGS